MTKLIIFIRNERIFYEVYRIDGDDTSSGFIDRGFVLFVC